MAEDVGFEPTNGINRCWFSRPVLSATQPILLAYIPDPENKEAKATNTEVLVAALALAIKRDDPHIKAIIGNFMKDYEEYISK